MIIMRATVAAAVPRASSSSPWWSLFGRRIVVPPFLPAAKRTFASAAAPPKSSAVAAALLDLSSGDADGTAENIVIVGGGIIGTSVAYHLGKLGYGDRVTLLEQHQLTSGTTWHAAGLMTTFGSLSSTSMWMRQYTKKLYSEILPNETGMETGFMGIGFVEIASGPQKEDRMEYLRRVAAFNRFCVGTDSREVTPREIRELFPILETDDVEGGFYVPSDGRVNPTDACMALAKGARLHGVRILEGVVVEGITTTSTNDDPNLVKRVTGVTVREGAKDETATRIIPASVVVNCCGMYARQFAEQQCGVSGVGSIPNQAAEHYYLITEDLPTENFDCRDWPVIEDADRYMYVRPEGKGLLIGFFEPEGAAWKADGDGIPREFAFGQLEPDWDRMAPYLEKAMERFSPDIRNSLGVKTFFCGPESFTPDGNPIVGRVPELRNYYVAAGLNSVGIITGGGIGKILADWIRNEGVAPPSDVDVTSINVTRFHKYQSNAEYRKHRTGETLGNTYRLLYPHHQLRTCRNAKKSPLHDRLDSNHGARFWDVSGWESPAFYDDRASEQQRHRGTFGRADWFPRWKAEHEACRNNVALFDMSFMSKFLVHGRDAGAFLNRLSTADVDGEANRITYTQWLNEHGYLEADLTVTKLNDDQFLVVATDTMHNHVLAHMMHRLSRNIHAFPTDVTARYAQINIQGPKSRELLQGLTSRDLSNEKFEFRCAEEIDLGLARVICIRVTYVGELGYELFVPAEQATHVYDRICNAGQDYNLQHAGLKALGSLRLVSSSRSNDIALFCISHFSALALMFSRRKGTGTTATISIIQIPYWKLDCPLLAISRRMRALSEWIGSRNRSYSRKDAGA